MRELSLLEKFNILKDLTISSNIFIIILILFIILAITFCTTTRMNEKRKKKYYLIIYAVIIVATIIYFNKSFIHLFDYMMNNVISILSFPTLFIYLVSLIITNIIIWKTTLSGKSDNIEKIVNSIVFCLLQYLLILNLHVILSNKLDVYSQINVYSNKNFLALTELSSSIFIIWLIFLLIYRTVKYYLYKKKGILATSTVVVASTPKKKINPLIKSVKAPAFIRGEVEKQPIRKPYAKTKEMLAYENALTLEDYKLLLQLLKEDKEKAKEKHNDIVITEKKEPKRETPKKEIHEEQSKLNELLELYKSVS